MGLLGVLGPHPRQVEQVQAEIQIAGDSPTGDCETGQLGSGTRFQMHFACVIQMSLIYDQAGPNPGQMQAERIARVSTLWLPLAESERAGERERRSTFSHRVAGE